MGCFCHERRGEGSGREVHDINCLAVVMHCPSIRMRVMHTNTVNCTSTGTVPYQVDNSYACSIVCVCSTVHRAVFKTLLILRTVLIYCSLFSRVQ